MLPWGSYLLRSRISSPTAFRHGTEPWTHKRFSQRTEPACCPPFSSDHEEFLLLLSIREFVMIPNEIRMHLITSYISFDYLYKFSKLTLLIFIILFSSFRILTFSQNPKIKPIVKENETRKSSSPYFAGKVKTRNQIRISSSDLRAKLI